MKRKESSMLYGKGGFSKVNYLGWFTRGYYHDAPTRVKVESPGREKD